MEEKVKPNEIQKKVFLDITGYDIEDTLMNQDIEIDTLSCDGVVYGKNVWVVGDDNLYDDYMGYYLYGITDRGKIFRLFYHEMDENGEDIDFDFDEYYDMNPEPVNVEDVQYFDPFPQ